VGEVAINLHHHPKVLQRFVGDGARFGVKVTYSVEKELLGTAGALRPLKWFFSGEDAFVVLYGDVLTNLNMQGPCEVHTRERAHATIVVTRVEDPTRAGIVAFERGRVTRLAEKPQPEEVFSDWANAGIYVCSAEVLRYVAETGSQDFARDLFPAMLRDGRYIRAYPTDATVIDYGSLERLEAAGAAVRRGVLGVPTAQVRC